MKGIFAHDSLSDTASPVGRHGYSGKTGGRAVANLNFYATPRPPIRRFLFPSVPLRVAGSDAVRHLRPATSRAGRQATPFPGPAYVLVQHAPPVVAAGEPLDGTSPGGGSRQPATGGADPPPLSNDSGAFPGRKDERIMREVLGVWIKLARYS